MSCFNPRSTNIYSMWSDIMRTIMVIGLTEGNAASVEIANLFTPGNSRCIYRFRETTCCLFSICVTMIKNYTDPLHTVLEVANRIRNDNISHRYCTLREAQFWKPHKYQVGVGRREYFKNSSLLIRISSW